MQHGCKTLQIKICIRFCRKVDNKKKERCKVDNKKNKISSRYECVLCLCVCFCLCSLLCDPSLALKAPFYAASGSCYLQVLERIKNVDIGPNGNARKFNVALIPFRISYVTETSFNLSGYEPLNLENDRV